MIYKRGKHWHMDAMVNRVRYREALNTTDKREAIALEKKRLAEIQQGKAASRSGREFARKPFSEAMKTYLEERKGPVSERTMQFEAERLKPLSAYFNDRPLLRMKAEDIASYQRNRLDQGVSGRTVNMEVEVLRRMLKRAKVWNTVSEDVRTFPERARKIAKVLTAEDKRKLFVTAASKPDWMVAHCAAVLAVSTTCSGVELKNLRWPDSGTGRRSTGPPIPSTSSFPLVNTNRLTHRDPREAGVPHGGR